MRISTILCSRRHRRRREAVLGSERFVEQHGMTKKIPETPERKLAGGGDPVWDLPDPFTIDITVTDADVDRLGHTNNAVYLRWCELCAWAHADAVGVGFERWQALDRAMAIRRSELDFLGPSHAGDVIRVANWIVLSDGRLRASRRFQLIRLREGATLLRGELHFVCIEISSGKPRRTPPEFARAYVVLDSVRRALGPATDPRSRAAPGRPGAGSRDGRAG